MRRLPISIVFIIIYSLFAVPGLFAQNITGGNPYIQNYDDKDYKTPENQIWAVLQDQRGLMYFGNNDGLLEFDGTNWRLIVMPNKSVVRSLAMDSTGRIYVGAKSEFGYIETDTTGLMQYISLTGKIPEKYMNFGDVWQTSIINDQIIFRTAYFVFFFKDNEINVLKSTDRFHTGFCINNRFYVREWGKGLLTTINDSLKFIPQSEQFANERVYVMLPYEEDKILMVTRTQGIIIYSPNAEKPNRFSKPVRFQGTNNFLIKNQIYCGVKLNDDYFVLGTIQDGLIIIDKSGNILKHINKKTGLQDNSIWSIFIDPQKNIWAGLNSGISYIILNSPFTCYNENNGLQGAVYSALVFQNQFYAGTMLGIFQKDEQNNFSLVKNTKGPCWQLKQINDKLYSGHFEGVLQIKKNFAGSIGSIDNTWILIELSKQPGHIIAGTANDGLVLLEIKNGELAYKHNIKGFNQSSRWVEVDNEDNIWITSEFNGVYQLKLNKTLDSVETLNFYNSEHGFPVNIHNFVFKIKENNKNPRIVFGTEKGIYKFNSQTKRFIPDDSLNELLVKTEFIDKFIQDDNGNIYFQQSSEKGVLQLQKDKSYKLDRTPFLKLKGLFIENICPIDSTSVFYCTEDGIIHYNPQIKTSYSENYQASIRQVFANGKLIFGGTKTDDRVIKLPYKKYALQFSYSALYYEDHDKTQYSYFLEGYDSPADGWSDWLVKTEKEYTNLPEGEYVFNVKAKNIYEKESTTAQYQFEILAPWYRTVVAYIIYGILIFLVIWLIVKLNTRRLRIEKENLEKIIKERTSEIVRQKEDIEEKNIELEQQKEEINTQKENIFTQAKQLELKNRELEKLSIAVSKTDNAIVIMDAKGNFEWVNEGFTTIYDLTFDELITKRGKNILECSSNPDIKKALTKCINEKTTVNYEFSYQKETKEDIWVQTTITPIIKDNGYISKLIAIDSDITDIKKAEKEIKRQRDEITDSIIYSKHIQNAILPTIEYVKEILPCSFIYYKPKEIIGGDFYWVSKQEDKIIIAVADCTGHGVPGALMSMIGITFLNEIIINKQITDPAEILNRLRIRVIKALHQSEDDEGSKDGMDIALCVINPKLRILEYAGANNPLYIIRNNELTELSPDKMPVSIHRMEGRQFSKKEIKIQPGNLIYLSSDGFADQFGGIHDKKFQKSNFKQLLLNISVSPIKEQLKKISQSFDNWCGSQEQVDDVTVMGIKVE